MKLKTGKLIFCLGFFLTACNSGGSSSGTPASYSYTSGPPYNFNYNLTNLSNMAISGNAQQPTLTCNLSVESRTCSVTVQGNIGLSGGGYVGLLAETAGPRPPIMVNGGTSPCPQDPQNPNLVNCTLNFTYQGNGEGNIFMQAAGYSLMGNSDTVQLFLPITFYSPFQ